MIQRLSYKGMGVVIDFKDDDHAEVKIADRTFGLTRHGGALPAWFCDEAYFMSDDVIDVVRHLIDYWYIVTSPDTAPFEGPRHDEAHVPPGGFVSAHPTTGDQPAGGHGGGHGEKDGD